MVVCQTLDQAVATAKQSGAENLFILGGAEIYELSLPMTDEMILTHLPIEVEGDAYFPAWKEGEWEVVEEKKVAVETESTAADTHVTPGGTRVADGTRHLLG